MANKKLVDAKLVLRGIGFVCTIISLGANLLSNVVSDKREEIEIREAVQKEVQRQLAIPMKRG